MLRYVKLPVSVLKQLLADDLAAASAETGVALTDYFITDRAKWTWNYRVNQLAEEPAGADWIARAAVDEETGVVVGMTGFHGPPDADGMVEISYSVDPVHRRKGYATEMLRSLLRRAADSPEVRVVRATISPDNVASLATLAGFGFEKVGEQMDDIDGLEIIFERPADIADGDQ